MSLRRVTAPWQRLAYSPPGRRVRILTPLVFSVVFLTCGRSPLDANGDDPPGSPDSGTLRVTVSGLQPSATSGGTATVEPTGGTAGPVVTVSISAAGAGEATLGAGSYRVTYNPPSGYDLATDEAGEADVVVTAGDERVLGFGVTVVEPGGPPPPPPPGAVLIEERFEDTDFTARGWYDSRSPIITTNEHIPGSTSSLELRFLEGAQNVTGSVGRHLFDETDVVVLSYWVKYSANWVGSERFAHPHEFYLLTNKDHAFVGPAAARLEVLVEQNHNRVDGMEPRVEIRTQVFRGSQIFTDEPGPNYKNDWHFIEVLVQMNSAPGVADGVVRYWFDGTVVIDETGVVLRVDPDDADMLFNQLLIAPYMNINGGGSPVEQTMWLDDLRLATSR